MVTEGELIEIAQRRRKLEDANEETEIFLIARQERLGERIAALEAKHSAGKLTYDAWCRGSAGHENELNRIIDARTNLEICLEACRDDMNRLCDEIRKSAETGG